ncbi:MULTISPECIES: serine protein kinase RIO [Fervidicoccus]|uniref:non-specific serine/threonine protein kinase n=2 Tax=Fervidicoccus fontis TaxID=683846 RepID=I0A1E9_FERFK|nr:serine protein kinase RIO [Fervidicoccus fontis]AFH42806.1 protein kinase RIO family [Fervidicoccus fontis Kam940]
MRKLDLIKISGVVSAGKESRVYRGIDKNKKEFAIKIYLTFSSEFKQGILKYILGDPRFESIKIGNTHKLMSFWAKKEYVNLKKMYESGVSVPKPYAQNRNIVVMDFIGENGVRAPLLKELGADLENPGIIYNEIIENIKKIVCRANLVHGDLSEYNIMIFNDTPFIIDVSQAVHIKHPNAIDFLSKDIGNINRFFKRLFDLKIIEDRELIEEIKKCMEE